MEFSTKSYWIDTNLPSTRFYGSLNTLRHGFQEFKAIFFNQIVANFIDTRYLFPKKSFIFLFSVTRCIIVLKMTSSSPSQFSFCSIGKLSRISLKARALIVEITIAQSHGSLNNIQAHMENDLGNKDQENGI